MLDPMNNYHLVQAIMKEREDAAKQQRLINEALAARNGRPRPQFFLLKWAQAVRARLQKPTNPVEASCPKQQAVVCC